MRSEWLYVPAGAVPSSAPARGLQYTVIVLFGGGREVGRSPSKDQLDASGPEVIMVGDRARETASCRAAPTGSNPAYGWGKKILCGSAAQLP